MDSSSENSFAWTDTTSDSFHSINSTSMAADDINGNSNDNYFSKDGKKTKDKKSRKNNHDESDSFETNLVIKEEKAFLEAKINSSVKKKNIKIEPDSENEVRKKKKKIRNLEKTNTEQNDSQESMSYDETYLNMKVKQEDSSASCSTKHKKKKRKRTSSKDSSTSPPKSHENNCNTEINDVNVILKEETENETEISNIKKKKKKSKKRHNSEHLNLDIDEKMDIEETVVNQNSKGNYTEKTLQEDSEESGCDEISAIKCDDSHSPHTISFINKSIDEENTKVNYNNGLNISTKLAGSVQEQNSKLEAAAAKHRKQRISDRIRFEDDEDDTNTESSLIEHDIISENNKKPLKLQNFIKNNPNLKLFPQTFNNNTILTQDDEIWILKCPKEINIQDFDNTTLNIHGKCKIKVAGQTYEGSAEEEQSDTISLVTMDLNKYKISNVRLSGIINLRKRIPKAHFRDDNIMVNNQTNFIPLPETKCRHPLFGSNYKKALKIPAAIAKRLNVQDTEDTLVRTKRKKKKDRKERNALEQVNVTHSEITMKTEPELPVETGEKKKKKRKMVDDEVLAPKKAKRIKHDPDSAEAWESEKAIEENLFNF